MKKSAQRSLCEATQWLSLLLKFIWLCQVNRSHCFHSWYSKPTFRDKAKVIFPKLKSHHCVLLFQTLLQWLHVTLIIYLSSLPQPTKFHLISSLTISFISHELTSFNTTDLLFLQQGRLEVFALTFPWDCMSGWVQISNLNPKCHFLPQAFC